MPRRSTAVIALLMLSAGCYHAVINSGKPPSPQVIDKPWAHGFIFGLVPPSPVDAAAQCKNGVAKVETQMSFLNGLIGGLTSGIYTPISIKVTCAQ